MDGILIFSAYGVWCVNEQLKIIDNTILGDTSEERGASFHRIIQSEPDPDLSAFLSKLEKVGVDRFFVESQLQAEALTRLYQVKVLYYEDVELWRRVRRDFLAPLLDSSKRVIVRDVALQLARQAIREASEQKDQLIVQAMNALDDVEKMQNLVVSRLREWYGLHFPEVTQRIENGSDLAQLIIEGGDREQIQTQSELLELVMKAVGKTFSVEKSMGAEISQYDMQMIQNLARHYLDLQKFREQLEKYIDEAMLETAPNLRGLIGPILGARLIGLVGGLEKLARLPASTIQVLGAERAMFRALKTGARPPKHGVIFQHTLVHSAPWWQRGKIARIMAGKIAIAARIDLYSGEYIADELKQSINSRISEVKRQYPTGPKAKTPKKPSRVQRGKIQKRTSPKEPRSRRHKKQRPKKRRRE